MKTLMVAVAAAALCVPAIPAMAQEMPTEPVAANVTWYQVHMVKFKPGKRVRAHEIIDDYFIPTDKALGNSGVIDIHLNTGEWDSVVAFPMKGGIDAMKWDVSQEDIDWMNALAKTAGSMENANAVLAEWDSLVAREEIHIAHTDND